MKPNPLYVNLASLSYLLTCGLVLLTAIFAVVGGAYVEVFPWLVGLTITGCALFFTLDPLMARGRPNSWGYGSSRNPHNVIAGLIWKIGLVFFATGVAFVVAGILSVIFGSVYDQLDGVDIYQLQAAGQFFLILGWFPVFLAMLLVLEPMSRHWHHLPAYLDMGVNCSRFFRYCKGL